ncbi:uncharacterized protein OCT59_025674 [Rhizophagus irregularis]|nr:hypothetical protein OCT59_025674 [Rhizophagus irregularis]
MYEVISGLPPYYHLSHDNNLAIKICQGLRPRFSIEVPQLIVQLIKRCLDANPLNRPIAKEINSILYIWKYISTNEQSKILQAQINKINKYSLDSCITPINLGISNNTHSGAIYTSRLLDFNSLPEPKNSDDYYEQYDNIISKEFSDSLQIDISQLNNTHSGAIYTSRLLDFNSLPEPKNSDDYYEQYDNIISKEFSDSLQIDISQLNIN